MPLPAWAPAAVGGVFSALGARRANKRAIRFAREQMAFQERMSSTAHQREVKDLRKAGLNPILSATGGSGASTPAGATATQSDIITPAISSAVALRRANQEIKNLQATEKQIGATTRRIEAQIPPIALIGESVTSARAAARKLAPGIRGKLTDLFEYLGNLPRPDIGAYINSAKQSSRLERERQTRRNKEFLRRNKALKINVRGKKR